MTAMPSELARKRPANVVPVQQDNGRTINGQWRATRGGMTGWGMVRLLLLLLIGSLFAGYLLSTI